MRPVSQEEYEQVEKTECVEIRACTKTRKCGWKGTYPELDTKRIDECESAHICPQCGNDEFYIEYMPKDKFEDKYLKRVK